MSQCAEEQFPTVPDRRCSRTGHFASLKTADRVGRRPYCLPVAALLAIHAGLLAYGAWIHSPTLNEPAHLVAGLSYWKTGRFDVYCVNPPLVRLIAAVPVMLAGSRTDWSSFTEGPGVRPEFLLGEDFVTANGSRSFWLVTLARWICIPFSLLGGYICFRWASELYGRPAGLLSLSLWCFCPSIIAHGQLITCDAAAAALAVASGYTFWRWLKAPSWWGVVASGAVLGLGELSKTTLLVLLPVGPAMWLVYRWPERHSLQRRDLLRELGMLATRIVVCVYVINLAYLFEGTGTRLDEFQFVSDALRSLHNGAESQSVGSNRFAGTWLGGMPVPFPKDYVVGLDVQRRDLEKYNHASYLRGQFSPHGWWYYYVYALGIKLPVGTWILLGLAIIVGHPQKSGMAVRDELMLYCPAVVVFALVSSQSNFSEHTRYVLPTLPFAFVWMSRSATTCAARHAAFTVLLVLALLWSVLGSLSVYPHSLSYFNELSGGPRCGPAHLLGSNVDWGQDLLLLKDWLNKHPDAGRLNVAYFGSVDPRHANIKYMWPAADPSGSDRHGRPFFTPEPGWYAVSANFVYGYPGLVYTGEGGFRNLRLHELDCFRSLKPASRAGYSIFIFRVADG